ncbi:metallophosphoesterase [Massilia sp. GCM10023247]|uniref:metallophosphoesterase n=1 Tax=Massilia sp. GCM10023247 TaxID=3252643 RepID=UPI00361F9729
MKMLQLGWKRIALATLVLFIVAIVSMLRLARLETTSNGVHTRLLLPTSSAAKIGIHIYSGTGDDSTLPGFLDGPIVRLDDRQRWTATWFCENKVERKTGTDAVLDIHCAGKDTRYPVRRARAIPPASMAMPAKMLVLSDLEGNIRFLDAALQELGVADAAGTWTYGRGHLVIAGDSVDRGRDVFAVLWRLYALSQQAQAQGGAVHLLLGNHEQYMLRGNVSRAHREHLYALEQMGGTGKAFAPNTVLGAWLRRQPVVLQAGRVLVAHGGISPAVAATGLSVAQLNDVQRHYWEGERTPSPALDAVLGRAGLSQYRGYFPQAPRSDDQASAAEVQRILAQFGADTIVVGHTPVEQVTPLHEGRVIAIDVNTSTAASEALVFEDGISRVVPLRTRRELPQEGTGTRNRPLRLADLQDWRTLGSVVQRSYSLSQLPHPY